MRKDDVESKLPFSRRSLFVHGTLALFTLGLWLLVPAALATWRRGGASRKLSYGLWSVIAIVVLTIGFSLGSSSDDPANATAASSTVTQPVTVTVTQATPPSEDEIAASAAAPPTQPAKLKPRTFLVAAVADGDTIKLANGDKVQLAQIDSPESNGECFGTEAGETLSTLLPAGTRVRLEYDAALDRVDKFGRQLAYVFKGHENINHTLVVRGAASAWFVHGTRGKYANRLDTAAQAADGGARGLWGACSATTYEPLQPVAAKKPAPSPPPPPPAPTPEPEPAAEPAPASNCHPSYEGACLDPNASDYDCAGGTGNGPLYTGYVRVVGYDEYDLDRDGNGVGCES